MQSPAFNVEFEKFKEMIPYSRLAAELVNKLIMMPAKAFDPEVNMFKDEFFHDISKEELLRRQESCMFSSDPAEMDPEK